MMPLKLGRYIWTSRLASETKRTRLGNQVVIDGHVLAPRHMLSGARRVQLLRTFGTLLLRQLAGRNRPILARCLQNIGWLRTMSTSHSTKCTHTRKCRHSSESEAATRMKLTNPHTTNL